MRVWLMNRKSDGSIGPNSILRADYVIDRGRVFVANITHDGVRAPVVFAGWVAAGQISGSMLG